MDRISCRPGTMRGFRATQDNEPEEAPLATSWKLDRPGTILRVASTFGGAPGIARGFARSSVIPVLARRSSICPSFRRLSVIPSLARHSVARRLSVIPAKAGIHSSSWE